MVHESSELFNRPSKLIKLDEGRITPFSAGVTNVPTTKGSSQVLGSSSLPVIAAPKAEFQNSEQQSSQVCITGDLYVFEVNFLLFY